jgi:hypothetical protein
VFECNREASIQSRPCHNSNTDRSAVGKTKHNDLLTRDENKVLLFTLTSVLYENIEIFDIGMMHDDEGNVLLLLSSYDCC